MIQYFKNYLPILTGLVFCLLSIPAYPFADAQITSVVSTTFDGPVHHGLLVTAAGNSDPNLTLYEVNVREDDGNPFYATWDVYSDELMPYDDGIDDGIEVAQGNDPNEALQPNIIVRTTSIDFGEGDLSGSRPNQHQYIEIDNEGDGVALIDSITVEAVSGSSRFPLMNFSGRGATDSFHVGAFPSILTNIPPDNVVRIPVDFIPSRDAGRLPGKAMLIISTIVPPFIIPGRKIGIVSNDLPRYWQESYCVGY